MTLRSWREQDAPVPHRVVRASMAHLRPWMAWVANGYPPAAAVAFVASTEDDWDHRTAFDYAIFVSGRLAGAASPMAGIGPAV